MAIVANQGAGGLKRVFVAETDGERPSLEA